MKKIIGLLIVCMGLQFLPIQADTFAYFTILSPQERQTVSVGDEVEIRWEAHGFKPDNQHGITVRLAERNSWKRVRVGFVTKPTDNDEYTFRWIVPENFFERYGFNKNGEYFKVELRADVDGKLVRKVTSTSVLYIQKTISDGLAVSDGPEDESAEGESVIPDELKQVAEYTFRAGPEPWMIKKLTVVSDTEGDGFELDPNEQTNALKKVYIKYPNRNGHLKRKESVLVNGKTTFSGLDFYVPKHGSADLTIWVNVLDPKTVSETFSGQTFRLGLLTTGNSINTFEAVGQLSNETDYDMTIPVTSGDIEEFVVRSGVPVFKLEIEPEQELHSGTIDVYAFSITANSDIEIARLVFDVEQSGLTAVDEAQLFKNDRSLSSGDDTALGKVYLMWDVGGKSCFAHTSQYVAGDGMDCNGGIQDSGKLILTFTNGERIYSGQTNYYKLRLDVLGASDGDYLMVRLATGDDSVMLNVGGSVPNTGKLFNGGFGNEIFTQADDLATEATQFTDRNVIWSDMSAKNHFHPPFTPAALPTVADSSSADYTNGYLFKLNALPRVFWEKQ